MFLKNYTSDVPAEQTIFRIQQVLLKAGVSSINMDYGPNQTVVAITFAIQFDPARPPVQIRMPADVEAAQQALWVDYADGDKMASDGESLSWGYGRKKKKRKDFLEQGARTAWKLVQDWIEVQLSMVQLRQADFVQVFLPYVWDGKRSFYQSLKDSGFKALMPPKKETEHLEVVP